MIYESIKMVFKVFKTNKLRTFLTMLGIIIGIFSITIIFAISSATKQTVNSELAAIDFSEISVEVYGTYIDDQVVINIPESEIKNLELEECIESVYQNKVYEYKEMMKKIEKLSIEERNMLMAWPQCTGTSYKTTQKLELVDGRNFTKMDEEYRMPFCIIQTNLAERVLGKTENIIGEKIKINNCEFEIIGQYDEEEMYYGGENVYVLNSYANDYFEKGENDMGGLTFTVKPISLEKREEAVEIIREKLLEYMGTNEFYINSDMQTFAEETNTIIGIVELVFAGIAGLSLLVGGIGIMNIMLVSVNERIKEIGIRMALGANSGNIKIQFLIEGVMLTLLSGIIGMLIASGAISVVNMLISNSEFAKSGFSLGVDFGVMIKTVLFCGVIGVIFGLYPAKKASELNPIDALRYE
ncbi:MAG: ABC transporter permease [Clostridia bacterium]|nr:ABC transporter permease [Clostridia bacterium]